MFYVQLIFNTHIHFPFNNSRKSYYYSEEVFLKYTKEETKNKKQKKNWKIIIVFPFAFIYNTVVNTIQGSKPARGRGLGHK